MEVRSGCDVVVGDVTTCEKFLELTTPKLKPHCNFEDQLYKSGKKHRRYLWKDATNKVTRMTGKLHKIMSTEWCRPDQCLNGKKAIDLVILKLKKK